MLAAREIKISRPFADHLPITDGKGVWRAMKYEEIYLRAYTSVSVAHGSIARYLGFYNSRRLHSSFDGKIPDQAYINRQCPKR